MYHQRMALSSMCSRWSMLMSLLLLWVVSAVFVIVASSWMWETNTLYVYAVPKTETILSHVSQRPRANLLTATETDIVDTAAMLSIQNHVYNSTVIVRYDSTTQTRGENNTRNSSEVYSNSTQLTTNMYPTSNQSCSNTFVYHPPISKPSGCRDNHCSEFLTPAEKACQKSCLRQIPPGLLKNRQMLKENNCSFMNGQNRLPVALISPEGSGNTWVRGLLEKATGICTGFIYCDSVMRMNGYIGEDIKSGSVLVAKTHTWEPRWSGIKYKHWNKADSYYGSAVFILRNPYHAAIAEWNRRVTNNFIIPQHLPHNESHTNTVPKKFWGIAEWNTFVSEYAKGWKARIINWVLNEDERPVHVVRYEDLKKDTATEVAKMLDFLGIEYTNRQDIYQRICQGYTEFKRIHTASDDFEHFTQEERYIIGSAIKDVLIAAKAVNKSHILRLEEYT